MFNVELCSAAADKRLQLTDEFSITESTPHGDRAITGSDQNLQSIRFKQHALSVLRTFINIALEWCLGMHRMTTCEFVPRLRAKWENREFWR